MASGVVDICLIPEVPFILDGPHGLLAYLETVLTQRGHAVICMAEGAAQVSRESNNGIHAAAITPCAAQKAEICIADSLRKLADAIHVCRKALQTCMMLLVIDTELRSTAYVEIDVHFGVSKYLLLTFLPTE